MGSRMNPNLSERQPTRTALQNLVARSIGRHPYGEQRNEKCVKLNLLGDYSTASWSLSKDRNGSTLVVDPPISGSLTPDAHGTASGIDLSEISFGANTTLAYAANNDNTGGTLTVSDGLHASMASDGHGGTLITDPALTQQLQLTLPHA
jgi:hypothetical protein